MLISKQLFSGHKGPVMMTPERGRVSLLETVAAESDHYRAKLTEHGAILFRGFRVDEVADFHAFVDGLTSEHMRYIYRSTPRSVVTERVSTATNYPAQFDIPMHNENSYQNNWPLTLAFFCTVPAVEGGETPLACMRSVSRHIGAELLDKFEAKGVEYVRHYHVGIDLPWQDVFQTQDKEDLHSYCDANNIAVEWLDDKLLRTVSRAQGAVRQPISAERIFFNQAHLFHASSLGKENMEALMELFGADRLPRHARFGDGSEIGDDELTLVNDAFRAHTHTFTWQAGDVLWVDNLQYAHGRKSFKGPRSVFASLMEPSHPVQTEGAA